MRKHVLTATCAILCLGAFGISTSATARDSGKHYSSQVVWLQLSSDPQRRQEDLKALSQFDVLGVNHKSGTVQVQLAPGELKIVKAMGFQLSFAEASWQNNNYDAEAIGLYMQPDQVLTKVRALGTSYPSTSKVFEVGKTTRGRSILGIEISSTPGNVNKPVILFNAMHHAREVMTTEVAVDIAEQLLAGYGSNADYTRWMNKFRIVVVPQVNPDGNYFVHNGQSMWRKNAWKDSWGSTYGVDLNRNYPAYWKYCNGSSGTKSSDTYRGPSAGSEPETKGMMNLVSTYKPIADISYHSYSELVIFPYGCSNLTNPSRALFQSVGGDIKKGVIDDFGNSNTYELGTAPELLYNADGSDIDWQWKTYGTLAFTIEMNSSSQGFQPNYGTWRNITVQRQRGGWQALIRRMETGAAATVVSRTGEKVSYDIEALHEGQFVNWAPDRTQSFEVVGGSLYRALTPGTYRLHFHTASGLTRSVDVHVTENGMSDLGTIEL